MFTSTGLMTSHLSMSFTVPCPTVQVKLGNKAPVERPKKATPWSGSADDAAAARRDSAWLEDRTPDELEELGDEFDDDRGLEAYRWVCSLALVSTPVSSTVLLCLLKWQCLIASRGIYSACSLPVWQPSGAPLCGRPTAMCAASQSNVHPWRAHALKDVADIWQSHTSRWMGSGTSCCCTCAGRSAWRS